MEQAEGEGWSSKQEGCSPHQMMEEGKRQDEELELVPESKEPKKRNREIELLYLEYGTPGNTQVRREQQEEPENQLQR